jgi:hypothetical protein
MSSIGFPNTAPVSEGIENANIYSPFRLDAQ